MVTFLLIILYVLGCVIAFFLLGYDLYSEFKEIDNETTVFIFFISLLSWFSVASILIILGIKHCAYKSQKINFVDKITSIINNFFSKKYDAEGRREN